MAHVAELDEQNKVLRVIVVHNDYEPEVEAWATQWAGGGVWKQTSYNGTIRKNFAAIGDIYDEVRDAFISPRNNCHAEEFFNEDVCRWECSNAEHIINIV